LCKLAPLAARIKRADGWFGTSVVPQEAPISSLVEVAHQIVAAKPKHFAEQVQESQKYESDVVAASFAGAAIPSVIPSMLSSTADYESH